MAAPVLLVADDLSLIAAVKRALAREGHECVLTTSAADAIIAFGHALPSLLILQPSVESGRGNVVLEELRIHPEARLLKVLLLGETIPGFGFPVEPLPVDVDHLCISVNETMRAADSGGAWEVRELAPLKSPPRAAPQTEPEPWRATRIDGAAATLVDEEDAPAPPFSSGPSRRTLERNLFSDLPSLEDEIHRDVESQVRASVESALPPLTSAPSAATLEKSLFGDLASTPSTAGVAPPEAPSPLPAGFSSTPSSGNLEKRLFGDLPSLEDEFHRDVESEVRASVESSLPPHVSQPSAGTLEKTLFADLSSLPSAVAPLPGIATFTSAPSVGNLENRLFGDLSSLPSSTGTPPEAQDLVLEDAPQLDREAPLPEVESLALPPVQRAEHMVREARALAEAERRAEAADARIAAAEREALVARAQHAEALVGHERETRRTLEAQLETLRRERDEAAQVLASLHEQLETERQAHAELEAQLSEASGAVQVREEQLAELARRRDERISELTRSREERFAELNRQQAETISALTRRSDEQLTGLRAELSEALAALELAANSAADLEVERTAHADSLRALEQLKSELKTHQDDVAEWQTLASTYERERELHVQTAEALASAERVVNEEREKALQLDGTKRSLEHSLARAQSEAARAETLGAALAEAQGEVSRLTGELEELREALEAAVVRQHAVDALQAAGVEHEAELVAAKADVLRLETERTAVQTAHAAAAAELSALESRWSGEVERSAAIEAQLVGSAELLEEAAQTRERLENELVAAHTSLAQARELLTTAEHEKAALHDELERSSTRLQLTAKELAQSRDALDATRSRAEQAEAIANLASEKVRTLEAREVMPLSMPGARVVGLARHGAVELEGLARLVSQLAHTGADARVELGVPGGTRTLWLKKGHVIAATSTFDSDSVIDRARRDGLIDARQEAELRVMRTATLKEQLEALKVRGFIRDVEAVPLLQRCAEHIALEALSEPNTQYRLSDDAPGPEVTPVTMPRATLPLLAEALRRATPSDSLLEQLGGGEAIPTLVAGDLDLRALGFGDRERKMLSWIDGEATVEDVSLASGLPADAAFRALVVAKQLGVVEVKPPVQTRPTVDPELEVRRLEAKYDEVQDADYFTVLGLERTAGTEDVQRAWQRLSNEFHPLRFSGHPDAGLQQRAQLVYTLLEEAARALEDDRRRSEYARHLMD